MKHLTKRSFRWLLIALVVLALLVPLVLLWLAYAPPAVEVLTGDAYRHRIKRFALLRDARAWLARTSPKTFQPPTVHVSASFVPASRGDTADAIGSLPAPNYSSEAVRIWLLSSNDVAQAEAGVRSYERVGWRVITYSGTPSRFGSSGTGASNRTTNAYEFASYPKVRPGQVEVAAIVSETTTRLQNGRTTVSTNHETAFRLMLKPDQGGIVADRLGILFIWAHELPH